MKKVINGQALNEVEVERPTCGGYGVSCAFSDSRSNCNYPDHPPRTARMNFNFCNNPPRIFLRDDQVLEYIAGRLKHGG